MLLLAVMTQIEATDCCSSKGRQRKASASCLSLGKSKNTLHSPGLEAGRVT
jgi:hypothetical protein